MLPDCGDSRCFGKDHGPDVGPALRNLYAVPERRVVDGEGGTVEVWRFVDGADEPDTHDSNDVLRWPPDDGAPALEIDVGELFRA